MFGKKVLFLLLVVIVGGASLVCASEIRELAWEDNGGQKRFSHEKNKYNDMGEIWNRVLCVDGLKVFQTIAFSYGNGSEVVVSNVQLYEEKNGRVVPIRCGE